MPQPRHRQRRTSKNVAVDTIPMKGIKPIWYAVGAAGVLVVLGVFAALSIAGNRKEITRDAAPATVMPAAEGREEAAERRHHLEITQRSLERLKEEPQQTAEDKSPASPSNPPTVAAGPAATAALAPAPAPAPAPAQPKVQKKQMDTLDNIGSDITKELGQ